MPAPGSNPLPSSSAFHDSVETAGDAKNEARRAKHSQAQERSEENRDKPANTRRHLAQVYVEIPAYRKHRLHVQMTPELKQEVPNSESQILHSTARHEVKPVLYGPPKPARYGPPKPTLVGPSNPASQIVSEPAVPRRTAEIPPKAPQMYVSIRCFRTLDFDDHLIRSDPIPPQAEGGGGIPGRRKTSHQVPQVQLRQSLVLLPCYAKKDAETAIS